MTIQSSCKTIRWRKPCPCCFGTSQPLFLLLSLSQPSSLRSGEDKSPSGWLQWKPFLPVKSIEEKQCLWVSEVFSHMPQSQWTTDDGDLQPWERTLSSHSRLMLFVNRLGGLVSEFGVLGSEFRRLRHGAVRLCNKGACKSRDIFLCWKRENYEQPEQSPYKKAIQGRNSPIESLGPDESLPS